MGRGVPTVFQIRAHWKHALDPCLLPPHGVNLLTGPGWAGSVTRPASDLGDPNRSGPNSTCPASSWM